MSHSPPQRAELRLFGLPPSMTSADLSDLFCPATTVLGVLLHAPSSLDGRKTAQWAQLWMKSEEDVSKWFALEKALAEKGITMSRAPESMDTWHYTPMAFPLPPTPPSLEKQGCDDSLKNIGSMNALPRNLYVLGVPIDMTQMQFRYLFVRYGMVEHSTLLSQLDNLGKRRGFILMNTHQEAVRALGAMNGQWVDGSKVDVSWALIQREANHVPQGANLGVMPNRVVHPPLMPTRREPPVECSVVVENLASRLHSDILIKDPIFFPSAGAVRDVFGHFGPVIRVTIIPGKTLSALIAFESPISATFLVKSNGMSLGGRPIYTRPWVGRPSTPTFDPFREDLDLAQVGFKSTINQHSQHNEHT